MYRQWAALLCSDLAGSVQTGKLLVFIAQFNTDKGRGKRDLSSLGCEISQEFNSSPAGLDIL